jgi:hypothetical protein
MSLADDLQKLEQLRSSGALSEEEFKQAKAKLISPPSETRDVVPKNVQESDSDDPLQVILWVIGIIVLLMILFALAHHHYWHRGPHY